MAITPSMQDPNRTSEIMRMRKIADGSEGKERIQNEFGIDLNKGPLPDGSKGPTAKELAAQAKADQAGEDQLRAAKTKAAK